MAINRVWPLLLVFAWLAAANAQETQPADSTHDDEVLLDARVDTLLRDTSQYIAEAASFSFRADITYDHVLPTGQKIQHGGVLEMIVRRPDRFYASYVGDTFSKRFWYDGQTFTIWDGKGNTYASVEVPANLNDTLDAIREQLDVRLPLADFAYDDPYAQLAGAVAIGFHVGQQEVRGVTCEHIAFGADDMDWQIWVQDGRRLLPRKVVITYRSFPSEPQYTAVFSDWDFADRIPDRLFRPKLPDDAERIEFLAGDEAPTP